MNKKERFPDGPPGRNSGDDHPVVETSLSSPYSETAQRLVEHLWEDLDRRYGPNPRSVFRPEQVDVPDGVFVIAWLDGLPAGCGVMLPMEAGVGEVKRMWVEPWARRRGVAKAVLARLEKEALAQGRQVLRLETGNRQPEAIALYHRLGFHRIPCWGQYATDPISLCFEKLLTPG